MFYINGTRTQEADDWRQGLADPELQWRPGHSAWALAHSWEEAAGFPPEILEMLRQKFPTIKMVKGLVEHKVLMPGKGKASQNDLFVVAQSGDAGICISIEGKVSEKLGEPVSEWHDGSENREARLAGILEAIGLKRDIPETIRYQPLHRMASAVFEAGENYPAAHAIMIVHSFSEHDESFDDFAQFLALYNIHHVTAGKLYTLKQVGNITLHSGWAKGDLRFLSEHPHMTK